MAMQLTGSLLIAIVILWLGMGVFFRLTQNTPMGFHTLPPGADYDQSINVQIEGQRRWAARWLRLWPLAVGAIVVAIVLIALG